MIAPQGVAVSAGVIYWANHSLNSGKVSFALLDGGGGGDLGAGFATVSDPVGVAVDHLASRVYWAGGSQTKTIGLRNSHQGLHRLVDRVLVA